MQAKASHSLDSFWQGILESLPPHEFRHQHSYFSECANYNQQVQQNIYPLHQLGLLSIEGPDATVFLQGQLTADVEALEINQVTLGAHCDAKGRMNSNFYLVRHASNHYLLQMPLNLVESAKNALTKYAVFSKVTLENMSTRYAAFGFNTTSLTSKILGDVENLLVVDKECDKKPLPPTRLLSLSIPSVGTIVWINRPQLSTLISSLQSLKSVPVWSGSAQWEQRLIDAGIGFIQPQTVGEFIPQMLNLDQLDGISFSKGCYTGQEIIARMKYRGQVKRRCYRFNLSSHKGPSLQPGNSIIDGNDKLVGVVVNAIESTEGTWGGLAVIKNIPITEQSVFKITIDGAKNAKDSRPLSLLPLPYAIPKEENIIDTFDN